MARTHLRVVIVLGALITLLGGTGIFAVFSDRATTGTASVTSGARAAAANLLIALAGPDATTGGVTCDPDHNTIVDAHDDLVGPLFTATNLVPGGSAAVLYLCLVNAGSGVLDGTATVIDLTDVEQGCTGDEATVDSCNQPGDPGELSPLILIDIDRLACGDRAFQAGDTDSPASYATSPWQWTGAAGMAPSDVVCLRINSRYRADVTESQAQRAQTDTATWRFAFDAVAR